MKPLALQLYHQTISGQFMHPSLMHSKLTIALEHWGCRIFSALNTILIHFRVLLIYQSLWNGLLYEMIDISLEQAINTLVELLTKLILLVVMFLPTLVMKNDKLVTWFKEYSSLICLASLHPTCSSFIYIFIILSLDASCA